MVRVEQPRPAIVTTMRIVDLKGSGVTVLEISPGSNATIDGVTDTEVIPSDRKIELSDLEIAEHGVLRILVPYWSSQIQLALEVGHESVTEKTIYPVPENQVGTEFVAHHTDQCQMSLMGLSYFVTAD